LAAQTHCATREIELAILARSTYHLAPEPQVATNETHSINTDIPMRSTILAALLPAFLLVHPLITNADDVVSGIPVGEGMISLPIEKLGGLEDGVRVGDEICYT
jgi:hypothetical protein